MLEPLVNARVISELAARLLDRGAAAEPSLRAEREFFEALSRAYFRDRERALAGVAAPRTTLLLEVARQIWDHLVEESLRWGSPVPADPLTRLRGDARIHRIITSVLTGTGHLPRERAERLTRAITGARAPGLSEAA
jgi:hypothetical protein